MDKEVLKDLLKRYGNGSVSEAERAFLESWYAQHREPAASDYTVEEQVEDANQVWAALEHTIQQPKRVSLWPRIAAAAAILVAVAFGGYFYLDRSQPKQEHLASVPAKTEIVPGGNNATLTLADGRRISLTDAADGELARQSGIVVTKAADGQLIYTVSGAIGKLNAPEFNTISTPNGGQYQVQLPDGTQVWLNAASSLKYPTSFAAGERRVELGGEAYFEVAPDRSRPFRVVTLRQTVEVLGTHFNVSSYSDEADTRTTLLEGSVRVIAGSFEQLIKPGQQAVLSQSDLQVRTADVEEAMAWKNGYFRFNDEKLGDVLRKLSRWYDVVFDYEGTAAGEGEGFNGVISRSKSITQALKMLEKTKTVQFKIKGRRITVMQ